MSSSWWACVRWTSAVRVVTNNACAIRRFVIPGHGHLGHAALARGERVDAGAHDAARPGVGGEELLARPLGERPGAAEVGELHAGVQRLARVTAPAGAPERRAQLHAELAVLEPPAADQAGEGVSIVMRPSFASRRALASWR